MFQFFFTCTIQWMWKRISVCLYVCLWVCLGNLFHLQYSFPHLVYTSLDTNHGTSGLQTSIMTGHGGGSLYYTIKDKSLTNPSKLPYICCLFAPHNMGPILRIPKNTERFSHHSNKSLQSAVLISRMLTHTHKKSLFLCCVSLLQASEAFEFRITSSDTIPTWNTAAPTQIVLQFRCLLNFQHCFTHIKDCILAISKFRFGVQLSILLFLNPCFCFEQSRDWLNRFQHLHFQWYLEPLVVGVHPNPSEKY